MKQIHLGVMGSGQLGQMLAQEAFLHGIKFYCYSPDQNSPSKAVGAEETVGSFKDFMTMTDFLKKIDILTFEFENIPKETLEFLIDYSKNNTIEIFPHPSSLAIAQDRSIEKEHFRKLGLKTPQSSIFNIDHQRTEIAFPWIIKTLRYGYDGKGQVKIENQEGLDTFLLTAFTNGNDEYLIEEIIHFDLEVSVILCRYQDGSFESYGTIENIHKNHTLDLSIFPARIDQLVSNRAVKMAETLANSLNYVGVLGVEFFIRGNEIFLNEFAPRPHNSGHFSQDGSSASQFKLHISAITNAFKPRVGKTIPTVMKNILGNQYKKSIESAFTLLKDDRYSLHLYGKDEARSGRKMGHLNFRGIFEDLDPIFFEI